MEILNEPHLKFDTRKKQNDPSYFLNDTRALVEYIETKNISVEGYQ